MPTDASKIQHLQGGKAVAIATHIDAAQPNADILCRSGFAYPIAIELARVIKAGVPCVETLRRMQFSTPDSITISAAIAARGAH